MVLARNDPNVRVRLLDTLEHDRVAIFPCDTIYGFVGRAPQTEAAIRHIKGRGETNPFLMLVGSIEQARSLSGRELDERVASLWPAPLTVVLKTAGGTAAVRLPADPFLTGIISSLGSPIFSTSVNRSGSAPLWRISEIIQEFDRDVDLIVDAGDRPAGLPSTILDISGSPYRILRQGAFQVPAILLSR